MSKKNNPTRFALTIVDTKNTFGQGDEEQYFNWNIGFDKFDQLYEPIAEEDGGTELNRFLKFVEEQSSKIKKTTKTKGYTTMKMATEDLEGEK